MRRAGILWILVACKLLVAQELSLQMAVHTTLQNHPDIKRAILELQMAQQDRSIAGADYLPQVTFGAEYDLTKTYALPSPNGFDTKDDTGWQSSVTLHQKIWDFSKTEAMVNAAKRQEEIDKLSLEESRVLLSYQVTLQYESVLLQQEALAVAQEDVRAKEEIYAQSEALFRQGIRTKADSSRIYASLLASKEAAMLARSNYKKACLVLSTYMGVPLEENVILTDKLKLNALDIPSVDEVIKSSLTLKRLAKGIEKSQSLYRATKRVEYGSIDAVGSYIYQDTLNAYDSKLLGVTYSVPLYSGGRNEAMIERSHLAKEQAKVAYAKAEQDLKEETGKILLDLVALEQSILSKEAQIQSATRTKEVMEARYRNGLATYIEVLDASKTVLEARLGYLSALYAKSSALHRLYYLKGEIE